MIRIFIGTEPAQWLPTAVLKRSICTRTKEEVSFHDLKDLPLGLKLKMYTGFSFYRFSIPEECHYEGRAIYLDADMVVLGDIKELYEMDLKGKGALAKVLDGKSWFTSCMLLDCAKLKHWKVKDWVALINTGLASYKGIMRADSSGLNHNDFGDLPDCWNEFDRYDKTTKLIHYTNVPTQPWKRPGHPFRGAFLEELKASLDDGTVTLPDIQREIAAKHIYPTILQDMDACTSSS